MSEVSVCAAKLSSSIFALPFAESFLKDRATQPSVKMATKGDVKTPMSNMKDPLAFPFLIVGRDPQKKEELEFDITTFRRTFGYKDTTVHADKLHCLAWNNDGTLLATGSYDKTVVLWSYRDGKLQREFSLKGHTHSVDRMAWNPADPDLLLTCSCDRTVKVWSIKQRGARHTTSVKTEVINLCWAPDGRSFVFGDKEDTLVFIDMDRSTRIERKFNYEVNEMAFYQDDGKVYLFLATGTATGFGGRLEYYEYNFPELIMSGSVPVSGQTSVVLNIDHQNKVLAVGSNDANVTLWDLDGLFPVAEITRQKQAVRSISFSHDSRFVATCTEENYVDVALVETGEKIWSYALDEREKESMNLVGMMFHPKKPVLACAYDVRDRNHRDQSIVRLFGVAPGIDLEKEKKKEVKREARPRSREREKDKDPAKAKDDSSKEKVLEKSPEKPRFESKFSFLRPTVEQLSGLEERKTAQAARDAKAAALAAAKAAAKVPTRVATRPGTGAQAPQSNRSGIRQPIRAPEPPQRASRSADAGEREGSTASDRSGGRSGERSGKKDDTKKSMPPPSGNQGSSGSSSKESPQARNPRKDEGDEPERKKVRSTNRENDGKEQRSSGRSDAKK